MMAPSLFASLLTLLALSGTTLAATIPGFVEKVKRDDLTCSGFASRPVGEVSACIDFLHGRGTTTCRVEGSSSDFCTSGDTKITRVNYSNKPNVASLCRDVAYGLQKVVDSCTRDGQVADLFVSIQSA
ncbi:hypothetical protein BDW59DRAFT_163259 [Aspergillus cavernicola]|uniref:Cyanovirin-N domain-containing protein n=1 Tax=Aspergillus cavernicola TaxID=176166 RepID=A0ABR4I6U8_9EURO